MHALPLLASPYKGEENLGSLLSQAMPTDHDEHKAKIRKGVTASQLIR
jgi:hypothetical protein